MERSRSPSDVPARSVPAVWLAGLLLLGSVLAAGWFQVHNLDLGLHARTGEWIVDHGRVPATNVMSRLNAGHPTVDDKWGFQVLAHLLFDGVGPDACIAARMLMLLLLFGLMARTARALGAGPWTVLFFLLLALLAGRSRFTFRPDLLSSVLTVLMAWLLLVRCRDGRGALWLLPWQLVWVNVHGYFITGPLMLAAVAGARALGGPEGRAAARRLLPAGIGMVFVCLLNPAGLDGALHPLRILEDLERHGDFYRSSIIEFRPTLAADPRGPWDRVAYVALGVLALPLLCGAVVAAWRRARAPAAAPAGRIAARDDALAALALCLLFGAMSFSLRRNMAPFAFVVAPLAAAAWSSSVAPRAPALLRRAGPVLVAGFALLVSWGELSDTTSVHDGLDRRSGPGLSRIAYPDAGIDFIARELPRAGVFTAFSYGSTFTGRRWPEQVASLDGNTHGYPTAFLIEALSAVAADDSAAFRRLCERDGLDVALLPMASPLSIALLRDPEWALVCVGVREAVWVRRAAMDPAWLARADLPAAWRAGAAPELPDTPENGTLPGVRRAQAPLAEIDQATLLLAAGFPEAALQRARAAERRAPESGEALALQGLACAQLGRREEARALLERSAAARGYNRLEEAARALLARL